MFCPHPPALVPEISGGAAAELANLRAACVAGIERIAALGAPLVLLGSAPTSQSHLPGCRGSFAPFGVPQQVYLGSPGHGGSLDLPLSLTIGAWLLDTTRGSHGAVRGFSVALDFATSRPAAELVALVESEDLSLVVLGDGSARRSLTAPGYFDERSAAFDESVVAALSAGNAAALSAIDAELGGQLLAAGPPAWHAAASVIGEDEYVADVTFADAPYGVGYFVATWIRHA